MKNHITSLSSKSTPARWYIGRPYPYALVAFFLLASSSFAGVEGQGVEAVLSSALTYASGLELGGVPASRKDMKVKEEENTSTVVHVESILNGGGGAYDVGTGTNISNKKNHKKHKKNKNNEEVRSNMK